MSILVARSALLAACGFILLFYSSTAHAQIDLPDGQPPDPELKSKAPATNELPAEIVLRDYLVIPSIGRYERTPLHTDVLEQQIVNGDWQSAREGDAVTAPDGVIRRWATRQAGDDGVLDDGDLRGGYALAKIDSPQERIMLLEASGHATVFVNGAARAGDPYQRGFCRLPIQLQEGENHLLFHLAGGTLRARLTEIAEDDLIDLGDSTLPDLIAGENDPVWGAVLVRNPRNEPLTGVRFIATADGADPLESEPTSIVPLSVRKLPFRVAPPSDVDGNEVRVKLQLVQQTADGDRTLSAATVKFSVRKSNELHARTFRSRIDGGIQSYAVLPAAPDDSSSDPPGIIVSLHGAAVAARKQAEQYRPKPWAHVIAPTGRRTFGFDWEDWGRIDALEALADFQKRVTVDPRRVWITGHSMGGHGAWHLAVHHPDRFAAAGPSAGWLSFASYGGAPSSREPEPMEELLLRAGGDSETRTLSRNLADLGVYVLHGQDDRNVPVSQARFMREELAKFHPNFAYYEKPEAGHWFGSESVDWPPMMEFFRRHQIPPRAAVKRVELTTVNPGVTSRMHWLSIESQNKQFAESRATVQYNDDARQFTGSTSNVSRLMIDLGFVPPGEPLRFSLDGQTVGPVGRPSGDARLWLVQRDGKWTVAGRPSPALKGPKRYGLFKSAFGENVIFVYATGGNDEENDWALAKARYDAETFWYRGNGAVEVVPDTAFDPNETAGRSVILYGHADMNSAWPALLSTSPIQVRRGQVRVGLRPESGDDVAILFIRPRAGSERAYVGVVAGTGPAGMNATNRIRYFVSGIAYPDLFMIGADALTEGQAEVRALGYFGDDWGLETGEFLWRDLGL